MIAFNKKCCSLLVLALLSQGCLKPKKMAGQQPVQTAPAGAALPATADLYAEHVRTSEYQTPEQERLRFVLPPGFEVTLFAAEPDITKPINMAFDEKGRLWVSQSSEYPVAAGPGGGKDRISILEDTDRDGRADKIQDFATGLNIPIGIMPVKGGAIGYSIPNLYRFTDTDQDGKADQRQVLFGAFGHQDTHGMVNNLIRGFDGWIHASHGYANTSVIAGTDGDSIRMYSGNTFRFRPDGSRVEKTTDGRINPFGSAFDEMGYHYSADCHTLPIYQLIWGGDYTQWGKKETNMGFAPTMMDYGLNSTALAGLVYYTDNQFPDEYRNSFYSGDVVTCRISRNVMQFTGSTPRATRKEDFLVSRDPWFRPVDIKIGPDGAMYIADFYNRIIGHYEVPINHPGRDRVSGRIWRITYKGQARKPADWSKASLPKLMAGLGHEVLGIRLAATDELVDRLGAKARRPLEKVLRHPRSGYRQRIQALWALFRLQALPDELLAAALRHPDVRVQVHAYKVLANYQALAAPQRSLALQGLDHPDAHVKRAAAEVLSRHPAQENCRKLITSLNQVPDPDTHLRYTLLLALKNHLQQPQIMQQVAREQWKEKEMRLIALVASDLQGEAAARFLFGYLQAYDEPQARRLSYLRSVASAIPPADMPALIRFAKNKNGYQPEEQYKLAMALNQGLDQRGGPRHPALEAWNRELAAGILAHIPTQAASWGPDMKARQQYAAEVAGRYQVRALEPQLRKLLTTRVADEDSRAAAASALIRLAPQQQAPLVLKAMNNGEESVAMRQKLARALGQAGHASARTLLGQALKASPYEVQETIATILVGSDEGKSQLLQLIRQGYAPARLLKSRAVEERLLANISPQQRQDYAALTANIQPISQERQKLIDKRLADFEPRGKTVAMGKAVFAKNCSMCHQIGKKGGLIGPQLDGIGNWGRSALTTKILDPNRNISEDFRTYHLTLKDGRTVSGLHRRQEGQLLVLANPSGEEFSVNQQDIKEKAASQYTLMPDHFNSTIAPADFDALLVYLLSNR